jgi:hypothetical protein
MKQVNPNPDGNARSDRGTELVAAGVVAAYIHEISGRHRDAKDADDPTLGTTPQRYSGLKQP